MFAKIKSLIEYCGLSYKFEIFKIVFINILGIVSSVICYLFLDKFLYLILGIIVTLICDYFLLSSYSSKKNKLDEERENEFVKVISNFEIFISNKNNVYQSFNKVIPYCSEWMKDSITKLIRGIDSDKSVEPYIKFAKLFKSNIVTNIMLSIYSMVDQGESFEQINNFHVIFDQFQASNQLHKIEKKKRSLSILQSMPLLGAGGITIALTMSIISIIGDLLNVI